MSLYTAVGVVILVIVLIVLFRLLGVV